MILEIKKEYVFCNLLGEFVIIRLDDIINREFYFAYANRLAAGKDEYRGLCRCAQKNLPKLTYCGEL